MPEVATPHGSYVVGGGERLGYALPMASVERIVGRHDLPAAHRRVTLARLLDGAHGGEHSRFGELAGARGPTYLELGEDARVRTFPADAVEPVPPLLATTARRWGWAGLLRDGARYRLVLDAAWLASLAAERSTPPTGARP